jgi:hypothetical protein
VISTTGAQTTATIPTTGDGAAIGDLSSSPHFLTTTIGIGILAAIGAVLCLVCAVWVFLLVKRRRDGGAGKDATVSASDPEEHSSFTDTEDWFMNAETDEDPLFAAEGTELSLTIESGDADNGGEADIANAALQVSDSELDLVSESSELLSWDVSVATPDPESLVSVHTPEEIYASPHGGPDSSFESQLSGFASATGFANRQPKKKPNTPPDSTDSASDPASSESDWGGSLLMGATAVVANTDDNDSSVSDWGEDLVDTLRSAQPMRQK